MFIMQPHRRSTRPRTNNNSSNKVNMDARVNAYKKANRVETVPGRKYREKNVDIDIYDECPNFEGYKYDKDMYLANERYATDVDKEIAKLAEKKDWDEAVKAYEEDTGKHLAQFKEDESEEHPYAGEYVKDSDGGFVHKDWAYV
jgi:hypothetical protein